MFAHQSLRGTLLCGLPLLALLGCKDRPDDPGTPDASANRYALVPFQTCEELQDHLVDVTVESLVSALYSSGWGRDVDLEEADDGGEAAPNAEGGTSTGAPSDYTGTNLQELGVDEPDIVKTDGEWIYAIQNGTLYVIRAWPAADAELVATLQLDGWPDSLFLWGDRLVAFSANGGGYWGGGVIAEGDVDVAEPSETTDVEEEEEGDVGSDTGGASEPPSVGDTGEREGPDEPKDDYEEEPWYGARIQVIDLTDRTQPTVLRTLASEGYFAGGRLIGSDLYLVENSWLDVPPEIYEMLWDESLGLPEVDWDAPEEERKAAADTARDILTPLIAEAFDAHDVEEFLPQLVEDDGAAQPLLGCTDLYRPPEKSIPALLNVLHLDLSNDAGELSATGVLSSGGSTYASQDNLYVSFTSWSWGWGWETETVETQIHKFGLGGDAPEYLASGAVDGWTLNQFAFSEHEDALRVATTVFDVDADWEPSASVTVLKEEDGALNKVGALTDIAPGEQIFGVRMIGETGYVVTFEQTDPLFTVDLSDPTAPKLVGELEVFGYSAYLHPVGDDHLLAVGMAGDEEGLNGQLAVSVFDVSDLAAPKLAHQLTLGDDGGWVWSEALYDHHAFTFADGVLSIPANWWDESAGQNFGGLVVLGVDVQNGITEIGRVDHSDFVGEQECWWTYGPDVGVGEDVESAEGDDIKDTGGTVVVEPPPSDTGDVEDPDGGDNMVQYCWTPEVRRSIYMEDFLYSLSSHGVKVNELLSPDNEVASVPFPDPYGWYSEDEPEVEPDEPVGDDDSDVAP